MPATRPVVVQQLPQLRFRERPHPRIIAQRCDETAHPHVREPVERSAAHGHRRDDVCHLHRLLQLATGLQQRTVRLAGSHRVLDRDGFREPPEDPVQHGVDVAPALAGAHDAREHPGPLPAHDRRGPLRLRGRDQFAAQRLLRQLRGGGVGVGAGRGLGGGADRHGSEEARVCQPQAAGADQRVVLGQVRGTQELLDERVRGALLGVALVLRRHPHQGDGLAGSLQHLAGVVVVRIREGRDEAAPAAAAHPHRHLLAAGAGPAVQELAWGGVRRVEGEDAVRCVLEDNAAAQQLRGRVDDELLVRSAQAQVREDLVDAPRALDPRQLLADEQAMGGLGDAHIAGPVRQDDDRQVHAAHRFDEERTVGLGRLAGLVDDLDDEARSTGRVQTGEEVTGAGDRAAEPRAAAEDELAALQERGHLVRLCDVHPADRIAQSREPAQHLRTGAADLVEMEDRPHRHGCGGRLRSGRLGLHGTSLQSVMLSGFSLTLCPWSPGAARLTLEAHTGRRRCPPGLRGARHRGRPPSEKHRRLRSSSRGSRSEDHSALDQRTDRHGLG